MRKIQDFKAFNQTKTTNDSKRTKRKAEAAFKAGKAPQLVDKIARVIGKRIGVQGGAENLGEPYRNEYGKFMGFYGDLGGTLVRFNFKLGGSDILESIDIFDEADSDVISTIDLMGYSITQVVGMVADVFTGEYERYEEAFQRDFSKKKDEARKRTLPNYIEAWLGENPQLVLDLQSGRFNFEKQAPVFIAYIQAEHKSTKREIKTSAFQLNVRKALEQANLGVAPTMVPAIKVKAGPDVATEVVLADPDMAKLWSEIQQVDPQERIDDMREGITELADASSSTYAILIYGKAGVGKDYHVEDVFRQEGVRPFYITTPVDGQTGLLALLYEHKDDAILVFSDNDSAFKNKEMTNIWKNVIDTKPVRMVNLPRLPFKITRLGIEIDENFAFTSKVVFISNEMNFDKAILSRLEGYEYYLDFTKEEVLELIQKALSNIYSENADITDAMRLEVFEFVKKSMPVIDDIDFRVFRVVLKFRLLHETRGSSDWKRRSLKQLTKRRRGMTGQSQ